MIGVAAAVILAGYTVTWFGREMLRGCKPSWSELLVPGRYVGCHDATGSGAAGGGTTPGAHQENPVPTPYNPTPAQKSAGSGGSSPPSSEGYMAQ